MADALEQLELGRPAGAAIRLDEMLRHLHGDVLVELAVGDPDRRQALRLARGQEPWDAGGVYRVQIAEVGFVSLLQQLGREERVTARARIRQPIEQVAIARAGV